jgi:predicted nucleotidyltransferase
MAVRHAPVINTSPVNDRALAAAVAALASCDGVQTAYLLGSAASGRLRSDSDVDVAILPSRRSGLSVQDRLFLTAALARVFGRTVDLGVPQSTAEAFLLLERSGVIDRPLAAALAGMVGFRNVAVHQYETDVVAVTF